jgi:hypothetical protein
VFIHSKRYFSSLAPDDLFQTYADAPFGSGAKPALDYVASLSPTGPEIENMAAMLELRGTTVMPNLVMHYSQAGMPVSNPWRAETAKLVDANELHRPIDALTGLPTLAHDETKEEQSRRLTYLRQQYKSYDAKNVRLREHGIHFLSASGASAFGVLPGSGQVDEIIAMQDIIGPAITWMRLDGKTSEDSRPASTPTSSASTAILELMFER